MSIVDEKRLLTGAEHDSYQQLLTLYNYEPYHFLVEVMEDQSSIDMNDINYIIILKVSVTYVQNNKSNTYFSQLGSQTWISELEDDFQNKYYVSLD